jgi:ABC-type transporter Mla subunit MlaD
MKWNRSPTRLQGNCWARRIQTEIAKGFMALQDLTPQLRTRLSRMERAVGWFVFLATALLLFGFGYYIYHTAERKGWFVIKAKFHTFVQSSAGLNAGDPVVMMGFPVGQITLIHAMQPHDTNNVRVEFEVREPYFRYIWSQGSFVKVNAAGFLDQRQLEITRGMNGPAICVTQPGSVFTNIVELEQLVARETNQWQLYQDVFDENSNLVFAAYTMLDATNLQRIAELKPDSVYAYNNTVNRNRIVASWHRRSHRYENFKSDSDDAWLRAVEFPAVTERLEQVIAQVQQALPNILALTNQIATVLDNTANATSNLNVALIEAHPMVTNFSIISAQLREPGGLGVWALGTNGNEQVQSSLTNVDALLTHLADITSNLNAQVQADSNMLGGISKAVADSDDFVQGLKRHWLLRSAFKTKTNAPAVKGK